MSAGFHPGKIRKQGRSELAGERLRTGLRRLPDVGSKCGTNGKVQIALRECKQDPVLHGGIGHLCIQPHEGGERIPTALPA